MPLGETTRLHDPQQEMLIKLCGVLSLSPTTLINPHRIVTLQVMMIAVAVCFFLRHNELAENKRRVAWF